MLWDDDINRCTGRFADVLALDAVIVFREENAGRLANDLAIGTGIRIRNREMLVAVQMTQLWYKQTNSWRKCCSRFN